MTMFGEYQNELPAGLRTRLRPDKRPLVDVRRRLCVVKIKQRLFAWLRSQLPDPHPEDGMTTKEMEEYLRSHPAVYLIADGDESQATMAKIGISNDPEKRLAALRTGNPKLQLLKVWYVENGRFVERRLHEFFHEQSVGLEWFRLTFKQLYNLQGVSAAELERWFGQVLPTSEDLSFLKPGDAATGGAA